MSKTMREPYAIGSDHWPGTSKVIEEAGELVQVLGKLIASGGEVDHWDGSNLLDRLYEEMGDLIAAIVFFEQANGLDEDRVERRAELKFDRFVEWHQSAQESK